MVAAFTGLLDAALAAPELARGAAIGLRVRGAGEVGAGGRGELGGDLDRALASFAFALGEGRLVLGDEAAAEAGGIDVLQAVGVLADEAGREGEEGVVAALRGIEEDRGLRGGAGGEQVEAAAGLDVFGAGAAALGLPLIDVEAGGDREEARPFDPAAV